MKTKISTIYQHYNNLRHGFVEENMEFLNDEIVFSKVVKDWEFFIYQDTGNRLVRIEAAKLDAPRIVRNNDGVLLPVAETSRMFDFYASGILVELAERSGSSHSEIVNPDDEEVMLIVDLLYLAPFQKKMINLIESDKLPIVLVEEITAIPAGENPFNHDFERVGVDIMPGLMVMYSTCQKQQVILVNTVTGRRAALDLSGMYVPVE